MYRDSLGHWYASFVVPAEVQPLPATGGVIGVDWGVKDTATTTSDAYDLPHPQHGRTAQAKLTRYDRMMARRKPKKGQAASKGYREEEVAGEDVCEDRPAAAGHRPRVGQARGPRP